jgi:hypothetical protein
MRTKDGETTVYKINNFSPKASYKKVDDIRTSKWPFVLGRHKES